MDLPQLERMLDAQSPQKQQTTYAATKSTSSTTKLTTQVTVNLRQFKRRLSDVGIAASTLSDNVRTTQKTDVRHSVCGNELYELHQKKFAHISDVTEKGDRQFSQRKNETIGNHEIAASSSCISHADTYMSNVDLPAIRTQSAFSNRVNKKTISIPRFSCQRN